ncbi:MAG: low specificity L-threonine aldolase [Firmicutes bacterium]|nr:low specificity L-threonine aldolase [Bacillota bacterium]
MRIDLRSDTVTTPTPEMRRAMAAAEVGDDVYGEDPTVRRLEEKAAELLGKEAGLYVPSGTMGNLVAVMTHTSRGSEIILEAESHIYYYEVGGLAVVAQTLPRLIAGRRGCFGPEDLAAALRTPNIHFPTPALVCLENTHNRAGGAVWPPGLFDAVARAAHAAGLAVHLDGARIFNAAVRLGRPAAELVREADSVMFCLSKGLAAPVGSVLVGTRDFIARARKNRKIVGGGLRQAGVLAAAGLVALETMIDRLAEDHANARRLAEGLVGIPGLGVDLDGVETNMVMCSVEGLGVAAPDFARRLASKGVLVNAVDPRRLRFVTHKDVGRADIDRALVLVAEAAREVA